MLVTKGMKYNYGMIITDKTLSRSCLIYDRLQNMAYQAYLMLQLVHIRNNINIKQNHN